MYVRIRSQYFTDERGKDSTLVVASEDIGRGELNTLGECVDLVAFAANQLNDARMLGMFRDELRRFVLTLVPGEPPASPPTPPPVRVAPDPRFIDDASEYAQ